jgi:hypothetical protein
VAYIRAILRSPLFADKLFFARYENTKGAYLDLMALSTARAILQKAGEPDVGAERHSYSVTVVVDGLSNKSEVRRFSHVLRSLHIPVRKVRGMKDESNALIRLADALAGFVRDLIDEEPYAKELDRMLKLDGKIREIK